MMSQFTWILNFVSNNLPIIIEGSKSTYFQWRNKFPRIGVTSEDTEHKCLGLVFHKFVGCLQRLMINSWVCWHWFRDKSRLRFYIKDETFSFSTQLPHLRFIGILRLKTYLSWKPTIPLLISKTIPSPVLW